MAIASLERNSDGASGAWIRPTNPKNKDAITDANMRYQDGTSATVLDIVQIPLVAPNAHHHHVEDHYITPDFYWAKRGRATWQNVVDATDVFAGTLWPIGDSSYHGTNDKVEEALAYQQTSSLVLIEPTNFDLIVATESRFGGGSQKRIRASFQYNGTPYNFVITDPWIDAKYLAGPEGTFRIGSSRLCISLPEVINGAATKLAAAVITPERI